MRVPAALRRPRQPLLVSSLDGRAPFVYRPIAANPVGILRHDGCSRARVTLTPRLPLGVQHRLDRRFLGRTAVTNPGS